MESRNESTLFKVSSILSGLVTSLLLIMFGSLLLGGIVSFTDIGQQLASNILFIMNYIVIFIGGIIASYLAGSNGWINGGLVGLIYMLIIILLGSLWHSIEPSIILASRVLIGFLVSALGGIIGVNIV